MIQIDSPFLFFFVSLRILQQVFFLDFRNIFFSKKFNRQAETLRDNIARNSKAVRVAKLIRISGSIP